MALVLDPVFREKTRRTGHPLLDFWHSQGCRPELTLQLAA
jgi:hypothetical protein